MSKWGALVAYFAAGAKETGIRISAPFAPGGERRASLVACTTQLSTSADRPLFGDVSTLAIAPSGPTLVASTSFPVILGLV